MTANRTFGYPLIGAIRLWFALIALTVGIQPLRAEITVEVAYSETADLYSMMDNVSEWLEGYTIPAYREEWVARFGWTEADREWAARYREYRQRTFIDDSASSRADTRPDGLFASEAESAAGADPLASYMLAQPDIDTARRNFDTFASSRDARMLRGFYAHFAPKWRVLLAESGPLNRKAAALHARFDDDATTAFMADVAQFYRSDLEGVYTVYYTRRPPGRATSAEPLAGNYMLLHSPTADHPSDDEWDTIVIHELVHFVSASQPMAQKRALTERFLRRCPQPEKAKALWLLEEPLAVAWGQAAYSARVLRRPFDADENWYGIAWVNIVARTLAPSILADHANALRIEDIVDQAADRCVDLTEVAARLR